jgi:hypothetical protein
VCPIRWATEAAGAYGTVWSSCPSDLTDELRRLLEPVFNAPGKRGPKHAPDLRRVVDAMLAVVGEVNKQPRVRHRASAGLSLTLDDRSVDQKVGNNARRSGDSLKHRPVSGHTDHLPSCGVTSDVARDNRGKHVK